ncbi:MAG: MerR family transcriptional regulator [Eubacteriales bacterium]|nr:MerR family transcriptional regulator [Eubacteriales bacterium]
MEYLTSNEMAQKWNVSSRMVAYYCKANKIEGALKKGKTWLLPAHAEKPHDHRFSKNKMVIEDNPQLQGALQKINSMDSDNNDIYFTNDVYKNLGLTRETLRYYEEIGLISPERNRISQYREFSFDDVSRLMTIDFYKKRGFTPLEIKKLMRNSKHDGAEPLRRKIKEIENNIYKQQRIVKRLSETAAFREDAAQSEKVFSVKELPLYYVAETFDAVSSLKEYRERVLAFMDLQEEDILSNLVRAVTFDRSGYKGTKMCFVRQAAKKELAGENTYLESGKCMHTVLKADSHDDSLMEEMFFSSFQWAKEHGESFKGVVYIFVRFVELSEHTEHNFYEVFIPLK